MNSSLAGLQLILFVVRIAITIYCVNKAGQLNRNKAGWGIFGFLLPIIAIIWIQSVKPKGDWKPDSDDKILDS